MIEIKYQFDFIKKEIVQNGYSKYYFKEKDSDDVIFVVRITNYKDKPEYPIEILEVIGDQSEEILKKIKEPQFLSDILFALIPKVISRDTMKKVLNALCESNKEDV